MIGRIRQQLDMIRYYSADRRETAWDRAVSWAVVGALALALGVTWVCDGAVDRGTQTRTYYGRLSRLPDGELQARFLPPDRALDPLDPRDTHWVEVHVDTTEMGLPFATSILDHPATTDLQPARGAKRTAVTLTVEERSAIADGAERAGFPSLRNSITRQGIGRRTAVGGWVGNVVISWMVLSLVMVAAIRLMSLWVRVRRHKRFLRRRELSADNLCVKCRYDLTGLEWNERCPECGSLIL